MKCVHLPIETDSAGDGCCRPGSLHSQDSDCNRECNRDTDCSEFNEAGCARDDNTCDGTVTTATCNSSGKCVLKTQSDVNACKRYLNCGIEYARQMPCPLGCFCDNNLDCAVGYVCDVSKKKCVKE